MFKSISLTSAALAAAVLLQGCGAGAGKPSAPVAPLAVTAAAQRGDLAQAAPRRVYSLTPDTLLMQLKSFDYFGDRVRGLAGAPVCGVDLYDFKYNTVGAADEPATASGAIMVPTGSDPACGGKRPLVLYGHGNALRRTATMATLEVDSELGATAMVAATFYAARGYIVVAPNYVGYDTSSLDYHPHHIASQQGKEMIDAVMAARKALPSLQGAPVDNGKLFLTGHSEGGYAAMAAHRAMQAAGMHVTASAPQSGNYAESVAFERLLSPGVPVEESTPLSAEEKLRYIMKFTGWQKAYGNLYVTPAELYGSAYASGIETLVPSPVSTAKLTAAGKIPPFAFANDMPGLTNPALAGPPGQSLFNTSYLMAIKADIAARPCRVTSLTAPLDCEPAHPMRKAWLRNDMRDWVPTRPMQMCGGSRDTSVSFDSTKLTYHYFRNRGGAASTVSMVDLEAPSTPGDPYAETKEDLKKMHLAISRAGQSPYASGIYHGFTAYLACSAASAQFFNQL